MVSYDFTQYEQYFCEYEGRYFPSDQFSMDTYWGEVHHQVGGRRHSRFGADIEDPEGIYLTLYDDRGHEVKGNSFTRQLVNLKLVKGPKLAGSVDFKINRGTVIDSFGMHTSVSGGEPLVIGKVEQVKYRLRGGIYTLNIALKLKSKW